MASEKGKKFHLVLPEIDREDAHCEREEGSSNS